MKLLVTSLVVASLPVVLGTLRSGWAGAWFLLLAPLALVLGRRRPKELLAVVASIVFSIVVVDVALRWVADDLLYFNAHGRLIERRPEAKSLHRYRASTSLSLRMHGDLTAMSGAEHSAAYREIHFESDAAGFRNTERSPASPYDVILLGDSFGAGLGSDQADGLTEQLFDLGRRPYSLAVGGAGPREQLLTLDLEIDRLARTPDARLVWLLFEGNDLDESELDELERNPNPHFAARAATRWSGFRKRSPLRQLGDRLAKAWSAEEDEVQVREAALPDGSPLLFYLPYGSDRSVDDVKSHRRYAAFLELFQRVVDRATAARLPIDVFVIPTKARIYSTGPDGTVVPGGPTARPSGFASVVGTLCQDADVPFHDLGSMLSARAAAAWKRDRTLLWWRDDTHWGPLGMAAAAATIDARLPPMAPPEVVP